MTPPKAPKSIIGHSFADPELLKEALTHPSALKMGRRDRESDYERLEFLGDRVLAVIMAEQLYTAYGKADAGNLAKRFNEMVRRETLAEIALEIGLDAHIRMSDPERRSEGHRKPAILADICEAVIGALYLDGGLETAKAFILPLWGDRIAGLKKTPQDPKMALQEWSAAAGFGLPVYEMLERTGPDHAPRFTMQATVHGESGTGEAGSKKEAEQLAAKSLLKRMKDHG